MKELKFTNTTRKRLIKAANADDETLYVHCLEEVHL